MGLMRGKKRDVISAKKSCEYASWRVHCRGVMLCIHATHTSRTRVGTIGPRQPARPDQRISNFKGHLALLRLNSCTHYHKARRLCNCVTSLPATKQPFKASSCMDWNRDLQHLFKQRWLDYIARWLINELWTSRLITHSLARESITKWSINEHKRP